MIVIFALLVDYIWLQILAAGVLSQLTLLDAFCATLTATAIISYTTWNSHHYDYKKHRDFLVDLYSRDVVVTAVRYFVYKNIMVVWWLFPVACMFEICVNHKMIMYIQ